MPRPPDRGEGADLRLPLLGVAAWAGVLAARGAGPWWPVVGAACLLLLVHGVAPRPGTRRLLTALLLVVAVSAVVGGLRHDRVTSGPVAERAAEGAVATVTGRVVDDPRVLTGPGGEPRRLVRLRAERLTSRGRTHRVRVPLLVVGDERWARAPLGSTVDATGRLVAADGPDVAGLLVASGPPRVRAGPDPWWRAAGALRASIRDAVAHRPDDQRALVPALVDGDDSRVDDRLEEEFRTTGLTHLLAVSGTNLTLVVGFLLVLARWVGVRGRWLTLVGAVGVLGFVLLARTEPSVLRAAVMGSIALVALGTHGRQRALRGLGGAVVVLLWVEPTLAAAPGFALSVLATAGILVLGPGLRDALARWLPRWAAEAVVVPLAAQLACTPLVAGLSGEVSLVAVVANLLAAPAVAPATVLGLGGGVVGLVWDLPARGLGTLAGWSVGWIAAVAGHGAALPTASVSWGSGPLALSLLSIVVLLLAWLAPAVLRRRSTGMACCLVMVVVVLVRPPTPGWPPAGWVVVACDVGQGDLLAVRTGPGHALVVDAGPEPAAARRCLDDLDVEQVPLLVLTHFHADHVDGLAGVLAGRHVDRVETTRVLDPPAGVRATTEELDDGPEPLVAPYGATRQVGAATVQVLWPRAGAVEAGSGDGDSANDASVVLLVEVAGVRLLLTGDLEPPGQAALARLVPGLEVDVLKVPHHGSRHQDLAWLSSLGAEQALVSVGADNDYGHPAPDLLTGLEDAGAQVWRTDRDGDVAVVVRDGRLAVDARAD
ncbi:ComEC/Rec2 family competence protein [Nocardioides sp. SYSU D00038]|uniref:ComEC/Rec2 family competence protein n=1 Tax=Nocardioides sp. SYSU D00038 TaxID=2812554 RepID=UPI001967C93F|nr:ComEC/Rec2 family competence protein [Nocardioides sp. SYSU D00038]